MASRGNHRAELRTPPIPNGRPRLVGGDGSRKNRLTAGATPQALAVRGDRDGIALAVIPANTELDFRALAHCTGDRKIEMLPLKEVQAATGYIRGGVTGLACKKDFRFISTNSRRSAT